MSDPPGRVRVVTAHVSGAPDPVRCAPGDVLGVGHRDRQWPSYLWCTDQSGRAGWVPESYIVMTGAHEARALRAYDATELTVGAGEELEALDEAGGWLLCRSSAGLTGWVPADHVEPAGREPG